MPNTFAQIREWNFWEREEAATATVAPTKEKKKKKKLVKENTREKKSELYI